MIKDIAIDVKNNIKISKEAFLYIQYFIEQRLINILQMANNVAIYSGRIKLFPTDIEIVLSVMENRMPSFFNVENQAEIKLPNGFVKIEVNKEGEISESVAN